jgi:hypothetical protein
MYFFRIIGTNHLIAKKYRGWKWTFKINFKATTYVTCIFHSSHLSFNSTLHCKKTCNSMLIWAKKKFNNKKKNSITRL